MKRILPVSLLFVGLFTHQSQSMAQSIDLIGSGMNHIMVNQIFRIIKIYESGVEIKDHDSKFIEFCRDGYFIVYEGLDIFANKQVQKIDSVSMAGPGKWKISFNSNLTSDGFCIVSERKEGYFDQGYEDLKVIEIAEGKLRVILEKVEVINREDLNAKWKPLYTDEYLKRISKPNKK